MRKAKKQMNDGKIKYWSTANERIDWELLGWVLVFLEGYQNLGPHTLPHVRWTAEGISGPRDRLSPNWLRPDRDRCPLVLKTSLLPPHGCPLPPKRVALDWSLCLPGRD